MYVWSALTLISPTRNASMYQHQHAMPAAGASIFLRKTNPGCSICNCIAPCGNSSCSSECNPPKTSCFDALGVHLMSQHPFRTKNYGSCILKSLHSYCTQSLLCKKEREDKEYRQTLYLGSQSCYFRLLGGYVLYFGLQLFPNLEKRQDLGDRIRWQRAQLTFATQPPPCQHLEGI